MLNAILCIDMLKTTRTLKTWHLHVHVRIYFDDDSDTKDVMCKAILTDQQHAGNACDCADDIVTKSPVHHVPDWRNTVEISKRQRQGRRLKDSLVFDACSSWNIWPLLQNERLNPLQTYI